MKKNRLFFVILTIVALGVLTIVSCKKDESKPKPTPDFTYEINDKTVTFTNSSTTSEEVNPVHEYAAYGDYDVRLTATGEGGQETKRITISIVKEWPAITIDGDFSDWDDVEVFYGGYGDASGTLTEAKVTSNASYSKLYFYVKGTLNDDYPYLQVMIDADGDIATGWTIVDAGLGENGAEYQFEYGFLDEWCATYAYEMGDDPLWPWDNEITADEENGDITETSGVIGESEIEFVIETSLMVNPPMSTTQIGIYFWQQPWDWFETSGYLPPLYAEPLEVTKMFSFQ